MKNMYVYRYCVCVQRGYSGSFLRLPESRVSALLLWISLKTRPNRGRIELIESRPRTETCVSPTATKRTKTLLTARRGSEAAVLVISTKRGTAVHGTHKKINICYIQDISFI